MNPPEAGLKPISPPPQTVEGCLTASGAINEIKGDFLDDAEIFDMWRYVGSDTITVNDTSSFLFTYTIPRFSGGIDHWEDIRILSSVYMRFRPVYRFWFIGPPQVVGKLYFVYNPRHGQSDPQRRAPFLVWDLAVSDYIDVRPPVFNTIPYRPVRPTLQIKYAGFAQQLNLQTYDPYDTLWCGDIEVYHEIVVQAPNIFPDQYTIMEYVKLEDVETAVITHPTTYGSSYLGDTSLQPPAND